MKGKWGFGEEHAGDSHVCDRKGGGMEEELFVAVVLVYKSLYLNSHPTFEWEGEKVSKRPIFIKTDSGAGRQKEREKSIKFRHDMHQVGMYMGPGLPNTTSATQEMDALYKAFKGMCDRSAQGVFT